mmetsp:Transcript_11216/g.31064  ORF Transcript_11216/g.31064 Transcript_11216/m.31064 type:complete len:136 (-) Transcript_11216:609-1016(-)
MLQRTCSRGRATRPSRQPSRSSLSRPPEVSVPGRILDLMWGEEVLSHVQLSHVPRGRVGSSISFRSRIAVQGAGRLDRRQMVLDLDALFSVFHAGPRGRPQLLRTTTCGSARGCMCGRIDFLCKKQHSRWRGKTI